MPHLPLEQAEDIPIGRVFPNPNQPRKVFAQAPLEDLAASILQNGLMQPITVVPRRTAMGDYQIVMGERRYRASLLAKATEIRAIVRRDLTEQTVSEMALGENLLREDLTIIEEARAYAAFLTCGYTVESLAKFLGIHQARRIQERLDLLKLAGPLLDGLAKGAITPTQAYEMSRLSEEGQFTLWRAIGEGKCPTTGALRKMTAAILDRENQREFFKTELTKEEKATLAKVDRFVERAAKLVGFFTPEELAALDELQKSNARACAAQLGLLEKLCRELKDTLLSNAGKQELTL